MKTFKKILKGLLWFFIGLVVFVAGYWLTEKLLSRTTVPEKPDGQPKTIDAWVFSNGVHTDLVFPARSALKDWNTTFPYSNTLGKDSSFSWIAIGWGDKGFYLNTPEWKDLTFSTAFKAVTGLGETALHVTYYKSLSKNENCRPFKISEGQYQKLIQYVEDGLDRDASGKAIYIVTNAQYNQGDAFYEAKGSYSLFHTCNTWSNNGLKAAGLKASKWAAFDKGILYQYQ